MRFASDHPCRSNGAAAPPGTQQMRTRLTPVALSALVDAVAGRVASLVCATFVSGGARVNEWGALSLTRQVRDLEESHSQLLSDPAHSISPSFARLERCALLLSLDRPSDLAMYALDSAGMGGDEARAVLACRFGAHAVTQLKLPWEPTPAARGGK